MKGEVTTRDLVRNALRMRPDRIIIGECRGPEALDMLQAMNTGHEGSMTTIHANDTRDAISRLEMMMGMAGFDLPIWIIRRQIASAVQLVVQVARLTGGVRRVIKISEITGMEGDVMSMHDSFGFKQTGVDETEWPRAISLPRHPPPVPREAGDLGQHPAARNVRAADAECLSSPIATYRRDFKVTPTLLSILTFLAAGHGGRWRLFDPFGPVPPGPHARKPAGRRRVSEAAAGSCSKIVALQRPSRAQHIRFDRR